MKENSASETARKWNESYRKIELTPDVTKDSFRRYLADSISYLEGHLKWLRQAYDSIPDEKYNVTKKEKDEIRSRVRKKKQDEQT